MAGSTIFFLLHLHPFMKVKLVNHAYCKTLGNRVFEAKIITQFILAFKNKLKFTTVKYPIDGLSQIVLV